MKQVAVLLDGQIRNDGRVRRVVESLSEQYFVDLYCVGSDFDDKSLFNEQVNVFHYHLSLSWWKINLRMDKKFSDLVRVFSIQQKEYDFIYCNDYPLLSTAVELKKQTLSNLIYDSHEIYIETINQFFPTNGWKAIYGYPLIWMNRFFHSNNEKKHILYIDQMITVCDSLKNYFEDRYKIENIFVIRNCPKHFEFSRNSDLIREQLKLPKGTKVLLYQGDVNLSRGIEKIVEAMSFLNENIHFVVLGAGAKFNEFRAKYANERIHFMGKVPFDLLYAYTSSSTMGITIIEPYNLSKKFSLPNKVFEYMVAGIPFITNNLPEASRIAREENCGFIIDDSSPESIAKGINDAFNNPNLKEMGMSGYNAIVEKYNWEKEVEKLINYISK